MGGTGDLVSDDKKKGRAAPADTGRSQALICSSGRICLWKWEKMFSRQGSNLGLLGKVLPLFGFVCSYKIIRESRLLKLGEKRGKRIKKIDIYFKDLY